MDNALSPFLELSRAEWARLRANTPLTLDEEELVALRGVNEFVALDEVRDVYLPLSRLLNLRVAATQHLHEVTSGFLGVLTPRVPFVIAVAGSVAVGKSTISRILQALLARWPGHPSVDLVTTDGFLYPNAELERRGLLTRKGFPESYDVRRLRGMLADLKSGAERVEVPLYSHITYDVVADEVMTISRPDIVIVEGINVLQVPPTGASGGGTASPSGREPKASGGGGEATDHVHVSDYFDFSIYVDAVETDVEQWYVDRTFALREGAFQQPDSFFHFLTPLGDDQVREFAHMIWNTINGVNLRENIAPTRSRAHLILEKGPDHSVRSVRLRKL